MEYTHRAPHTHTLLYFWKKIFFIYFHCTSTESFPLQCKTSFIHIFSLYIAQIRTVLCHRYKPYFIMCFQKIISSKVTGDTTFNFGARWLTPAAASNLQTCRIMVESSFSLMLCLYFLLLDFCQEVILNVFFFCIEFVTFILVFLFICLLRETVATL